MVKAAGPKTKYSLKKGRVYIHKKCGEATCVAEEDFVGLCNSYEACMGTMCSTCGRQDGLKSFKGSDAGETLAAYRLRFLAESPPFVGCGRMPCCHCWECSAGSIGAAVFIQKNAVTDLAIGAVIGAPIPYFLVGPMLIRVTASTPRRDRSIFEVSVCR